MIKAQMVVEYRGFEYVVMCDEVFIRGYRMVCLFESKGGNVLMVPSILCRAIKEAPKATGFRSSVGDLLKRLFK